MVPGFGWSWSFVFLQLVLNRVYHLPSKPTNQPFIFSDKSKLAIRNNENQQGTYGLCQIEWESRSQFKTLHSVPGILITGGMSSKIWENGRKRQMKKLVMLPEIRFLSYFCLSFVVMVQQKGYLRTNKSLVQWQVILRCRNHCWLGNETTYLRPKNWGCLIRTGDGINGIITRTSILVYTMMGWKGLQYPSLIMIQNINVWNVAGNSPKKHPLV